MGNSLIYSSKDEKWGFLSGIMGFIDRNKIRKSMAGNGIKNIEVHSNVLKIRLICLFFEYQASGAVNEINNNPELKKVLKIKGEMPTRPTSLQPLPKIAPKQFNNITNSMFARLGNVNPRKLTTKRKNILGRIQHLHFGEYSSLSQSFFLPFLLEYLMNSLTSFLILLII